MLSDKRSKLSDQFEEEIKALDAQIAAKKKPLYEQRRQIITGETKDFGNYIGTFDATHKKLEEECALIVTKKTDDKKKEGDDKKEEEESKPVDVENLKGVDGVPDFWFRSMKNNQMIWELVKEKDEEILKFVKHIEAERSDSPNKMLTVTFFFNANEFFTNT